MQFDVGDKVVVPSHGVGIVKSISVMNLEGLGDDSEYYVIKILDQAMTYYVRRDRLGTNGERELIPEEAIERVYEVLRDRETPADKQTWNRRYREYMNKIKSGDALEVAAVLRDLARLKSEKTLSFGERKMYDQAHTLIVQELAVARDVDEQIIKDEIEAIFAA